MTIHHAGAMNDGLCTGKQKRPVKKIRFSLTAVSEFQFTPAIAGPSEAERTDRLQSLHAASHTAGRGPAALAPAQGAAGRRGQDASATREEAGGPILGYASILAAVHAERDSRDRARLAAHLADTFAARLVGVAAERSGYGLFTADPGAGGPSVLPVVDEGRRERLRQAEALFAEAAAGRSRLAWRSDIADPLFCVPEARGIAACTARTEGDGADTAAALVDLACERAADLRVTGAYGHSRLGEWP